MAFPDGAALKILFVHQNFPGQFKHLAPALARKGHDVAAFTLRKDSPAQWQGIRLWPYQLARGSAPGVHPWVGDLEAKTIRGEAAFRHALQLREKGYVPDTIVAHPGWGESLFLKDVWPHAALGIYGEFFYHSAGADTGFDPEFSSASEEQACRLRLKNLNHLLHFEQADAGLSPTAWQASTFPAGFRPRISVIHDGIDTTRLQPAPDVVFALENGQQLTWADEVVTFVNRNLEPYRGFHVFMRALPDLLKRRPRAQVLIVGGDDVSYGAPPPKGTTWKKIFTDEVRGRITDSDWARVHFLGTLPYPQFITLLQVSAVHVYLTYPFVLSWSLLEAMACGCAIVASDTAPLREAITDGVTGRLIDFFDAPALAATTAALLEDPAARARLGAAARAFAQAHYDLQTVCLPRQLAWVEQLAAHSGKIAP